MTYNMLTQSRRQWRHRQCGSQSVAVNKKMCLGSHHSVESLLGQRGKNQENWEFAKSAEDVQLQ